MTKEAHKQILKLVDKGSTVYIGRNKKYFPHTGIKVDDNGDTMIVLIEGIKTPILYEMLWHESISDVESVIAKLEGLPF